MKKKEELQMIGVHLLLQTWLLWQIHVQTKHYSPSRRQQTKTLGFKKTIGNWLFKDADETRTKILSTKNDENEIIWSPMKSRHEYSKVTTKLRKYMIGYWRMYTSFIHPYQMILSW